MSGATPMQKFLLAMALLGSVTVSRPRVELEDLGPLKLPPREPKPPLNRKERRKAAVQDARDRNHGRDRSARRRNRVKGRKR